MVVIDGFVAMWSGLQLTHIHIHQFANGFTPHIKSILLDSRHKKR